MNPPGGDGGRGQTGGNHRSFSSVFPSTPEGWFPVKGKTRSHLNFESRPGVYGSLPPSRRSSKSALGCLTYSRIWCLSRGKRNILWPESCKGIELGNRSVVPDLRSERETGQAPSLPWVSGGGTDAIFWRGSGYGPGEDARRSHITDRRERHVDVFEDGLGGDSSYAVG